MFVYNVALLAILVSLGVILIWNLWVVRRLASKARPKAYPFISVLVPARNEERNIERCIRSLLTQEYPNYEVWVYDDDSTDHTPEILERLRVSDARLRLIQGKALPEGWLGKCFACEQLALEARGEWLLFTDADTTHAPESLAASIAETEETGADLLTLVTRLEMKSFWERLVLPLVYFIAFVYLPFGLIGRIRNPKFAIGNGQFMLFRRPVYETIGRHASVRNALLEDVWLARRVKAHGFKLIVRDGFELVSCRMYERLSEIWRGFSKNIFPALNYSISVFGAIMIFDVAAYLLPYGILLAGLLCNVDPLAWIMLPGFQMIVVLFMRLCLAARFGLGILSSILHPLGIALLLGIAVNSARWMLSGQGAVWKDRRYDLRSLRKEVRFSDPKS